MKSGDLLASYVSRSVDLGSSEPTNVGQKDEKAPGLTSPVTVIVMEGPGPVRGDPFVVRIVESDPSHPMVCVLFPQLLRTDRTLY